MIVGVWGVIRKISIGVMADSKPSLTCGAVKIDGAVMPNNNPLIQLL